MLDATLPPVRDLGLRAVIKSHIPNDGKIKKRGKGDIVFALWTVAARL